MWAWLDLNQRPHPYQQSRAYRYATLHLRRSLATVEGQVMRSYVPANRRTDRTPRLRDKLEDQPVAGKVMGLPGGRGSPIDGGPGQAACSSRALRLVRLAARTASPPANPSVATSTPTEARSQPVGLLGSSGTGAGTWAGVVLGL
jgi:hypothetical protein